VTAGLAKYRQGCLNSIKVLGLTAGAFRGPVHILFAFDS
jgi:hypothetical protein